MNSAFNFFFCICYIYLLVVYLWAKIGKLYVDDVESRIWSWIFRWWQENTSDNAPEVRKIVPVDYAEQIHDSVKEYTNNGFEFTLWENHFYSDFNVPCFSLDIVPTSNNIDDELAILEVRALDRFRKCTLIDNLLASRIISEKSQGKVYLHILYASNVDELARYDRLLESEKAYADSMGMQSSAPISDDTLSDAINLFDDKMGGAHYAKH